MKTVLVLFGGVSSEYSISLLSATSVIENIPKDRYNVVLLGITKDGRWLLFKDDISLIAKDEWENGYTVSAAISPDRGKKLVLAFEGGGVSEIKVDVCFPVLHGKNGEDGAVQGLLTVSGIPFVGCDVLSSAMCMDKAVTNMVMDSAGIAQARWRSITRDEYLGFGDAFMDETVHALGMPVFVKPANAGSSVGITKVKKRSELPIAIEKAFGEDNKILIEEAINGRELETAVLGNKDPVASCVGEILPKNEFYDFDAKYLEDSSLLIPAPLSEELSDKIRSVAIKAYRAMGCSGFARVDFFLSEDRGILLNEINTIPGFTSISMYPKLFDEVGIEYPKLITRLLEYAENRCSTLKY